MAIQIFDRWVCDTFHFFAKLNGWATFLSGAFPLTMLCMPLNMRFHVDWIWMPHAVIIYSTLFDMSLCWFLCVHFSFFRLWSAEPHVSQKNRQKRTETDAEKPTWIKKPTSFRYRFEPWLSHDVSLLYLPPWTTPKRFPTIWSAAFR